jgi:hypothetical protein
MTPPFSFLWTDEPAFFDIPLRPRVVIAIGHEEDKDLATFRNGQLYQSSSP